MKWWEWQLLQGVVVMWAVALACIGHMIWVEVRDWMRLH
jgi:hypothetical protein